MSRFSFLKTLDFLVKKHYIICVQTIQEGDGRMLPIFTNIFSKSEDREYARLMSIEYRKDYERARKDGLVINKKFVRDFMKSQRSL
jgi:hypothetical protein